MFIFLGLRKCEVCAVDVGRVECGSVMSEGWWVNDE